MSYLVDAGLDEGFQLETIRTRGRYYDSDIRMITIAPTLACNARCYYCYEQGIEFSMMSRKQQTFWWTFWISTVRNGNLR